MYLWHVWKMGTNNDLFVFANDCDNAYKLARQIDKTMDTAQRIDTKNISYVGLFGTCIVDVKKHKVLAEKIINTITSEYPYISKLPFKYFMDNYDNLQEIEKLFVYCLPIAYS